MLTDLLDIDVLFWKQGWLRRVCKQRHPPAAFHIFKSVFVISQTSGVYSEYSNICTKGNTRLNWLSFSVRRLETWPPSSLLQNTNWSYSHQPYTRRAATYDHYFSNYSIHYSGFHILYDCYHNLPELKVMFSKCLQRFWTINNEYTATSWAATS